MLPSFFLLQKYIDFCTYISSICLYFIFLTGTHSIQAFFPTTMPRTMSSSNLHFTDTKKKSESTDIIRVSLKDYSTVTRERLNTKNGKFLCFPYLYFHISYSTLLNFSDWKRYIAHLLTSLLTTFAVSWYQVPLITLLLQENSKYTSVFL